MIYWIIKTSIVPVVEINLLWIAENIVPFYAVCRVAFHGWLLHSGVELLTKATIQAMEQRLDLIIKYCQLIFFLRKDQIEFQLRRFVKVMKETFKSEIDEERLPGRMRSGPASPSIESLRPKTSLRQRSSVPRTANMTQELRSSRPSLYRQTIGSY